jgi:iron complex outermembrane receptor protein
LGIAEIPLFLASITLGQETPFTPQTAAQAGVTIEQVIVTGSNIPTAEEVGPNPVDTYRPQDIEKLGARNATDLLVKLPPEAGSTINQNIANGGDGSVAPNLRGLLPKETLVLIDGKRVAITGLAGGVDINLIPFPLIDHIDILKDGASAIYGSDAVAGVFNIFLIHKFRGLEIGGSIGNTNLGASNDARELEGWLKAGVGDDKTDIVIIADFYDRADIFSRDRNLTSNGNAKPFGGVDIRNPNHPGAINFFGFRLKPQFNKPKPHSSAGPADNPRYTSHIPYPDGNFAFFNFAALTPSISGADRQVFYGSFTRDICDKYLVLFADFKYARSYFRAGLAPTPLVPDPFHNAAGFPFNGAAGISVPLQNPFNPFTVANATIPADSTTFPGTPVFTGVRYRALEVGNRFSPTTFNDILFDVGLRGEMGEFGDYFKTWNWEAGFRYSRNEEEVQSRNVVSQPGLREALMDTNPATAFNPFLNQGIPLGAGSTTRQTPAARNKVYVTLHDSGNFGLPLGYLTFNGDLFNLPAGPVSFALGGEYHGERWRRDPDSLNTSFSTIGAVDFQASEVNRDVWGTYQEVRIPITSPTWNFPGLYSLEVDFAEREEWFSQNTSSTLVLPRTSTQYNAQRPKVSVRWQPLDPKYIGAVTLRGSYTEAFHAPTLGELTPAGQTTFSGVHDPLGLTPDPQVEEITTGNPNLKPEVAYEWTYGAVYSPKWIKGLTLGADFWHIDLRSIAALIGPQFILDHEQQLPGLVIRDPTTGAIKRIIDPNLNLSEAIVEGIDYEAIYILDSAIFGGPDWGRLTFTLNGTWLSRFVLQLSSDFKPINIAGQFVPRGFSFTGSLPRNRAYASVFYDGPADSWLAGFDIGATVHWTGQYSDDFLESLNRKVREWVTLDLIASYTFKLPPPAPVEVPGFAKDGGKNVKMEDGKEKNMLPISTAEYNPCGWRAWLNGTTITLGMQNVFDEDPPFVGGAFANNYDESIADVKGRFWYVQLKKRF